MSNIQGSPQHVPHSSQDTTQPRRILVKSLENQPPELNSETKEIHYKAQLRQRSESMPELPELPDEMLEQGDSRQVEQRSREIPQVGELLKAKAELRPTETVVKDGREHAFETYRQESLEDRRTVGVNVDKSRPVGEEDLHSPELDRAVSEYQQQLQTLIPQSEKLLKDHLRKLFKPDLKLLSEMDSGPHRQEQINELISKVKDVGRARTQDLGTDDELSILMRQRSPEDFKRLCAETVGELRSGKPLPYEKLSAKKKAYVDEIVKGMLEGLTRQQTGYTGQSTPLVLAQQNLRLRLEQQLISLPSGQRSQIALMKPEQLKQLLTSRLGANASLLTQPLIQEISQVLADSARLQSTPERSVEKLVKPLDSQALLGPGVRETLDTLKQHPGDPKALANAGHALKRHLQRFNPQHNTIWQLSLMQAPQIKDLLRQLTQASEDDLDQLATAVRQSLPCQSGELIEIQGKNAFGKPQNYSVPQTITLGKSTFRFEKFLAAASNGAVFSFFDGRQRVAVKLALNDGERDKVVKEINAHRELQGPDGSPHVIGLKGATSDVNGNLYIVQEFAPGGDVAGLSGKLQTAVDQGLLSPQARQLMGLYVLKQALEGMRYLHDERQLMHMDYKAENMMIADDGRIKMIDFGTLREGLTQSYENDEVDAFYNRAPERLPEQHKQIDQQAEVWSLGVMAYRLLIHDQVLKNKLFNFSFGFQAADSVQKFGTNADHRLRPGGRKEGEDGQTEVGLGAGRIDRLINAMMMPTSEQRATPEQLLSSPLFQDSRLNSPEMTEIFRKLAHPPRTVGDLDDKARLRLLMQSIQPELQSLELG